jgi:hypothetical protein
MKKVFISFLIAGTTLSANSQTEAQLKQLDSSRKFLATTDFVYPYIDTPPGFVGGNEKWSKYFYESDVIKKAIDKAKEQNIPSGNYTVVVKFAINPDSTIGDVKTVSKKVGYGLEEAAMKFVKDSGKWIPAHVEGENTKSYLQLPVKFTIVRKENQ